MTDRIQVRLFAAYRDIAGTDSLDLAAAEATNVREVWRWLTERHPRLERLPPSAAVNATFAKPDTPVSGGDEVAFLPPVSGG